MFDKKIHLEMIDATSKISLKMSCLRACDNNVGKAKELYDFLAADMAEIPDFDPVKPSAFEQIKQGASEVFGWLSTHRDDVAQGVSFVQSLVRSASPAVPPAAPVNVPPIPKL